MFAIDNIEISIIADGIIDHLKSILPQLEITKGPENNTFYDDRIIVAISIKINEVYVNISNITLYCNEIHLYHRKRYNQSYYLIKLDYADPQFLDIITATIIEDRANDPQC